MTDKVKAIELASGGSEPSGICVTTGWGYIRHDGVEYPEVLQKVSLEAVDRTLCEDKFAEINPISSGMICAAGNYQGPCNGDSGGPLVCRNSNGYDYLAGGKKIHLRFMEF